MDIPPLQLIHKTSGVIIDLEQRMILFPKDDLMRRAVKFRERERIILWFLIKRKNEIVSKKDIQQLLIGASDIKSNNVYFTMHSLRNLIKRVDNECCCLNTVLGKGYVFNPDLSHFSIETTPAERARVYV